MDHLTFEDEGTAITQNTWNQSPNDTEYPQRLESSVNAHPIPKVWPYKKGNTLLMGGGKKTAQSQDQIIR